MTAEIMRGHSNIQYNNQACRSKNTLPFIPGLKAHFYDKEQLTPGCCATTNRGLRI